MESITKQDQDLPSETKLIPSLQNGDIKVEPITEQHIDSKIQDPVSVVADPKTLFVVQPFETQLFDIENKINLKVEVVEHPLINNIKTELDLDLDTSMVCTMKDDINKPIDKDEMIISNDQQCAHECELCNRGFASERKLQIHMLVHSSRKPFECNVCNKQFTFKRRLRQHMQIHTGEKPFKCNICGRGFIQASILREHTYTHSDEKPYNCNLCDYKCSFKQLLRTHIRSKHEDEKRYKCNLCDYGTIFKRSLDLHMFTHTKERPFACHQCNYKTTTMTYLKKHMLRHTASLETDMLVHNSWKPFKCNVCNKQVTTKPNLRRHMLIHTGEKPFKCNICGRGFTQENILKDHMYTHLKKKLFNCNLCDYKCSIKKQLKLHIRSKHENGKPYKINLCDYGDVFKRSQTPCECNVCNKQFASKTNLKRHMLIHTGEKPFKCNICGHQFTQVSSLNDHMYTHLDEKLFNCNLCDYKCSIKRQLKQHIRRKHEDAKLKCDICSKKFVTKRHLRKHELIHTGQKPYQCYLCGYKCIEKSTLKEHLLTHSGEKRFQCSCCDYKCLRKDQLKSHIMLKHFSERSFKCNLCANRIIDESPFTHYLNVHSKERFLASNICNRGANKSGLMSEHYDNAKTVQNPAGLNVKPIEVRLVDNEYKPDLEKVVVEHSIINSVKTECDTSRVCAINYNITTSVDTDDVNISNESKQRPCRLFVHSSKKCFECDICGKTFTLKFNLKRHKLIHAVEKPFKCNLCSYESRVKIGLKQHLLYHSSDKRFQCPCCCYKCVCKSQLKRHIVASHVNEKPFQCNLCESKTIDEGPFMHYLNVHSKKKSLASDISNRGANKSDLLSEHYDNAKTVQDPPSVNVKPIEIQLVDNEYKPDLEKVVVEYPIIDSVKTECDINTNITRSVDTDDANISNDQQYSP